MPQTTGQISAKDLRIILNSQDISGSSNKVEITPKRKVGGTATFDGDWELTTAGKLSWEGTIDVVYTEVASEGADVAYAAFEAGEPVSLEVTPKGGEVGDWEWSGDIVITEMPLVFDGTSEDPCMVSFPFRGSGALTKATVAV